jgi:PAS domain S-box-containing protein
VIDGDGIIRYESPSVERLLGWRPEALVGTCIFDYVHPEDLAHVVEAVRRRIQDPAPVNPPTEFRVRAADGTWHVLAAMSRVTRDEGGAASLVVNSRDVTEQRALEERLRQAQRMESIGQLAGGIAHDFNNLLTIILGRSELVHRRLAPDDPMAPAVETIQSAARQGATLTQQLLAFGRKQHLSLATLDLNAVVREVVPILERLVGDRISLVTSLDRDLRPIRGTARASSRPSSPWSRMPAMRCQAAAGSR